MTDKKRVPTGGGSTALLDQGRALHAQGRLAEAFGRYQAAYAQTPQHPEVLHLLGLAYIGMGQQAIGMAFVRQAIERDPQAADFRANLATALAAAGQLDEALAQLEQAHTLKPDDTDLLATLAALHARLGRHADAERCYEQAIATTPDRAQWHAALARLRHARWAMPQALESAHRALTLDPAQAEALNMGLAEPAARPAARPPLPLDALRASPSLEPQAIARAAAERDLLVIDDFIDDPQAYRQWALGECREQAQRSREVNFPGVQTPPQPCGPIMQRIADALGRAVKWDSIDHGALRLSLASDDARADVHVDSPTLENVYGGVLYFSLPEHCRGGTSFYRHRDSGWDRRPDAPALKAAGYASFLDFQKRNLPHNRRLPFAQWLERREATWEWLFEVPMRFNRLVVFRSDYFHAITELFGDDFDNGRLVQLFHFEAKG